jgi:hypothetical protein
VSASGDARAGAWDILPPVMTGENGEASGFPAAVDDRFRNQETL